MCVEVGGGGGWWGCKPKKTQVHGAGDNIFWNYTFRSYAHLGEHWKEIMSDTLSCAHLCHTKVSYYCTDHAF